MTAFATAKFGRYASEKRFWILCILAASCAAVLPIALMGIPDNYDLAEHLRLARTFHSEIQNLNFSPGWAGNDNLGFGSLAVRFYPPLASVVMAATQLVTNSWYDTLWTNILLWMLVGTLGVYFWAKAWLPDAQAAMAAILYAVVPYHLFQIYQAFLFAEFVASAILPFCFLLAGRIVKRGRLIDCFLFAAAFSALLLSHIPSAIIGSLSLAVYGAFILERRHLLRTCLGFLGSFAISLATTSFHWVRLVTELAWVKVNSPRFYNSGTYDYAVNFFPMSLSGGWNYAGRLILDITVILTIVLIVPLCILVVLRMSSDRLRGQKHLVALLVTGLFAIFMMSSASKFLWNSAAFLQKLQFPWRWLSIASLVGSVAFVIGLSEIRKRYPNLHRPLAYAIATIIFAISLFNITQLVLPSGPVSRGDLAARIESMDSEEGCPCWWPTWAEAGAFNNTVRVSAGSRVVQISRWEAETRSFSIEAGKEETARIATFYYPYWKAEVNGKPADIEKLADGTMNIPLPPMNAEVKLLFNEPAFLDVSKAVSLIAWAGLLLGITVFLRKSKLKV